MFDSNADIHTLNSLIATTLDSVDGYTEAAKESDNSRFADMFTARASERRSIVTQLQSEVARLGGTPEDDGTVLASMHRTFLGLKAAVTGRDDKAIVNEVERGEDHILHKFQDALKDTDLSSETRAAVQNAFGSVRTGHDQMRDLKHSMEGSR
ncbi:MAG: PA2169 family four-helix-bundle protein [Sphingomonadales bacterium]